MNIYRPAANDPAYGPQGSMLKTRKPMTQKTNNQIAMEALAASEVAMEMHCQTRGIEVLDLSDEDVDFFINTALVEAFSPHTRMSEIMSGARADITIADLKAQLDKRQARIEANRNRPDA